ncbi:hypothetical protein WICMUC_003592 [Wickerhamomyces mucosus]|uniref:ATP synthase subunit 5, mitochondrial n=1 Tax=Wickerhamomyces mucosus TaxID=1378264 RepID=A0A9P8TBX7_9ASCO|nr:hypothetical protein WICMUC_003592 [Wickerhamomyces mucosus]
MLFKRTLATATKSIKPPVQLFGLDGTYATALFTAASKTTSIESASKSLINLQKTIELDPKIQNFLSNPALSSEDRSNVVKILSNFEKLDSSVSNLLKVLGENNRLNLLPLIFKNFKILNDSYNGIVEAIVISSNKLDSKILKKIENSIIKSKFVGEGKTLNLKNEINPDILGGLIVEVGDRTVDLSVSSKISKLNQVLKEAI